jgi:hypothetical protein
MVTAEPVAGDVAPATDAAAPVPTWLLMNRLVDGAVADAIDVPEQVNPTTMFPDVVAPGVAAVEMVAATPKLVPSLPHALAMGAATPESEMDPPEMCAGVPPVTVATTFAVPAGASIANT